MSNITYPMTIYYDHSCPLCRAEWRRLHALDVFERLRFVDASAPDFVAPAGRSRAAMLAAIHALTADGRWVVGVETLRLAYTGVGRGWLTAPTAWPLLRVPAERAYRWLAAHRHRLPRPFVAAIVALYAPRGRRLAALLEREAAAAAARAHCTEASCPLERSSS